MMSSVQVTGTVAAGSRGPAGTPGWRGAVWFPPGLVGSLYLAWMAGYFGACNSIWGFVLLSHRHARRMGMLALPGIRYQTGSGFDGQYYFCLAAAPLHAIPCLDDPGYRYGRILFPLVARVLALGRAELIPFALLALNVGAVISGTAAVALWLRKAGYSPLWALIFGFSPGLFTGVERDLAEPLSYALVALAILLFDHYGKRGQWWAACCFALAVLTRETSMVFPLVYGGFLLRGVPVRHHVNQALAFLAAACGPYLIYRLALGVWLAHHGVRHPFGGQVYIAAQPALIPFQGLLARGWGAGPLIATISIVIPSLILAGMGVRTLKQRCVVAPVVVLLLNVLLFVVLLNASNYADYFGTGRAAEGVILAGIYCIPVFDRAIRRRLWFLASSALWLLLAPFWFVLTPLWMLAQRG